MHKNIAGHIEAHCLLSHPSCSEFEGRDRLVKVAQEHRLQKLTDQLGLYTVTYPLVQLDPKSLALNS